MNKPDFTKMTQKEALELFLEIRRELIFYLSENGFSQRQISRNIGGSSQRAVSNTLNNITR